MSALDFIPLSEAKSRLVIHDSVTEYDSLVVDLIYAAVEFVEQYTSYMLYQRELTESLKNGQRVFYYPVVFPEIDGVIYEKNSLSTTVKTRVTTEIEMTVGYADSSEAPRALKEACYRLITYWFDSPEMKGIELPVDVQFTLNRFRRDSSI